MPLVLLTGSTDGIGRQTARDLARRGATLLLHGRSEEKLATVAREVDAVRRGAVAGTFLADLADLSAVRRLGDEVAAAAPELHVLLANAGVFMNEERRTVDGFETTFAVNHLAHLVLTHRLLPSLRASGAGRIVHVSSIAQGRGRIDWDDLQQLRRFDGYGSYALSKLANVLFTAELARRLGPRPVAHALHPGVVSTKLLREGFGMRGPDSEEEGARTSVHVALDPSALASTGGYWVRSAPAEPHRLAKDPATTARFYEESCRMVGEAPLPAP